MKNKKALSIFIFGVILTACGDRPSNVLPEDKMVSLMVDMELAEAYSSTQSSSSSDERVELGKRVLEAHKVSQETLDTTLAWYGRNMDEYSSLFEKVDKEIIKRRKKYTEVPGEKQKEVDNLWPYTTHLVLSPLSGQDVFSFNIPRPEIDKGDVLELTFHLPNPSEMKGTFGVEYINGEGEAIVSNTSSRNSVKMTLQTDSANEVSRIYGFLNFKNRQSFPLYIDSLSIRANEIDTLNYRSNRRSQKKYGAFPVVIQHAEEKSTDQNKKEEKVETESISEINSAIPVKKEVPKTSDNKPTVTPSSPSSSFREKPLDEKLNLEPKKPDRDRSKHPMPEKLKNEPPRRNPQMPAPQRKLPEPLKK